MLALMLALRHFFPAVAAAVATVAAVAAVAAAAAAAAFGLKLSYLTNRHVCSASAISSTRPNRD